MVSFQVNILSVSSLRSVSLRPSPSFSLAPHRQPRLPHPLSPPFLFLELVHSTPADLTLISAVSNLNL